MPQTQRDVRNRIGAVKNIQKITRAMEMVAAARLRRAEQRIEALRPYADALRRMTRQAAPAGGGAAAVRGRAAAQAQAARAGGRPRRGRAHAATLRARVAEHRGPAGRD